MANIFRRISDWFRSKPKAPTLGGHRGVALGYGNRPDPNTSGNAAGPVNRRTVSRGEVDEFVNDGMMMVVHSSNVSSAVYYREINELILSFHGGGTYAYSNISPEEARSFAQAQSKGVWTWDHLRVRGTKYGHKKPYVRLQGVRPRPPSVIDVTDLQQVDEWGNPASELDLTNEPEVDEYGRSI